MVHPGFPGAIPRIPRRVFEGVYGGVFKAAEGGWKGGARGVAWHALPLPRTWHGWQTLACCGSPPRAWRRESPRKSACARSRTNQTQ
eukprot:1187895-Prorocentrum_minimum.AAC.4